MELIIDHLSKRYGKQLALQDISLRCGREMLGLVGPNGAGKTTLMRILATLIPPSAGTVRWDGMDTASHAQDIRRVLGYLPQEFGVYDEFSARQFLRYLAAMKGLPAALAKRRVDELLELINLERDADRKLHTFSGGMRQRVGIAQALLNDPELLIVDEPTAGLDPAERVRFRTLLSSLTAERLVILSTHIIGDVEAVANRLVVLNQGRVIADTTPGELLSRALGQVWSLTVETETALQLQQRMPVSAMVQQPNGVTLRLITPTSPHPKALVVEPNLEDAYLLAIGTEEIAA